MYSSKNNIAEMRDLQHDIININRDVIKTKGENLVLLWEYLNREDSRKSSNLSHHRKNQIEGRISD